MARFRRGDAAALGEIYARFAPRIFRFLARLTGRADVAEDLQQETWIAAARAAPRLAEDTDLAAWLFTIARNKHRSWCRWATVDAARSSREGAEHARVASPAQALEVRRDLERALGVLPEIHREILLLVGCEGLDSAQAAAVLGVSAEAARQRLSRARAALGELLGARPNDKVFAMRKDVV